MTLAITFVGSWPAELRDAGEHVFAALQHQLAAQDMPDGTINLKLVDDAEIATLNKHYRGLAAPTDVLTFNYSETGEAEAGELADIAISTETAERQAAAAGISLSDEIGLLTIHGLLHALGYDHQTEAERQELDQLQEQIMTAAGLKVRKFAWKD